MSLNLYTQSGVNASSPLSSLGTFPSDIGSVSIFLDSRLGVTQAVPPNVSQWDYQAPASGSATQVTASNQPDTGSVINSKNAIHFNNTTPEYLTIPSAVNLTNGSDRTIIAVVQPEFIDAAITSIISFNTTSYLGLVGDIGNPSFNFGFTVRDSTAGDYLGAPGTFTAGVPVVFTVTAGASGTTVYKNQTQIATTGTNFFPWVPGGAGSIAQSGIAANSFPGRSFEGLISNIDLYSKILSTQERTGRVNTLMSIWGIV